MAECLDTGFTLAPAKIHFPEKAIHTFFAFDNDYEDILGPGEN